MRHISSRIQKALMVAGVLCAISIPALAKAPQGDIQVKPMHPFLAAVQDCVLSFQDYLKTETHLENGVEVTVMHLHADPSRKSFHSPQQVSLLDDGQPVLRFSPARSERPNDPTHPDLLPLSLS